MNWQSSGILIVAMISCAQYSEAQLQASEIKDEYQINFKVNGADKVTYSRNFNRHREFSYASCSAVNIKFCNVSLIVTDSKNFSKKTCKFELDAYEATETGIASLLLPDDKEPKGLIAIESYRVGAYDHLDSFMDFLVMSDCKSKISHFIGSIEETKGSPSHVILYHYPKVVTSAKARRGRRLIKEYEFEEQHVSSESMKYIRSNHTSLGEEQPVELGTSQGFFFVASNSTPVPTVDAMYVNLTTLETQMLGYLGSVIDPAPKTSGAYKKYGLCWKKLERDSSVNCTQFLISGQRSINQVSLKLSEPIDWLAVHNLREPAMLLVTGQCDSNGHCERFKVTKVHADGRASAPLEMNNLNATCPEQPLHLSMDVTEDDSKSEICFHFVCVENKYQASNKSSSSLQYRRKCIDQAVIAKIN